MRVVMAVVFVGIPGLVFVGLAWARVRDLLWRRRLRRVGVAVRGEVLERDDQGTKTEPGQVGKGQHRRALARVRFATAEGREVVVSLPVTDPSAAPGGTVPIEYDPARPERAMIPRRSGAATGDIGAVGWIFFYGLLAASCFYHVVRTIGQA